VFLLRAVEKVAQDTDVPIEVHLAGVVSAVDREQAEAYPFVRMPGYLDHDRTLELLRTADLLFLPMHDLPRGTRAGIVPGKTYEYLGSGRPILAAVPDGDARDLLEDAGAILCRPADVDCLAQAIAAQLERFREGLEPDPPRPGLVARYEYRALAATLAEVFERAVDHASPLV
jgi:glycosyltransferase involved in cell wall biosynthesis